jgi:hypothetical protein
MRSMDSCFHASSYLNSGLNTTLLPGSPINDHGDSAYGSCQTTVETSSPHSCFSLAHSTLDSPCFSISEASTILAYSQRVRPPSQTLNNVLRNNKAAISTIHQLLNCPCSHMPYQTMLYSSTVSKILHWYQNVGSTEASFMTPVSYVASSPDFMSSHTSRETSSSIPSSITYLPITMGAFSLDEEDQEAFRQRFLLSELRNWSVD